MMWHALDLLQVDLVEDPKEKMFQNWGGMHQILQIDLDTAKVSATANISVWL